MHKCRHRPPVSHPNYQRVIFIQATHGNNGIHVSTSKEAKNHHMIIFPFGVSSLGRTQKRSRDHFWRDVQGDEEKEISEEDTEYLKVQIKTQNKLTTKRVDKHIV